MTSFTEFSNFLPSQDIQLSVIFQHHRCDITSHNEFEKSAIFYIGILFKTKAQFLFYEINKHGRAISSF